MDNIRINGIKTYAYHGVLEAERVLGQFFITDVVMYLDLSDASRTDNLTETVHYGEAYHMIEKIIKGEPVDLIEHLAEKVSMALFDQYDKIVGTEVTITKINPPIEGNYDNVSITLNRKRED
ncbi:dihydroneopterin aldolase [Salinicoccus hispanicus]|uniref:7,8-dihydroneopterin aldolase n=1 Tax=Salinicoccus hispanicus TaxID=157225 RepID=A0A6N8U3A8_9STAP|nr:dihydroneopterin aldolase [Salinicoccus hispanicus]MXQ51526.1 dihydroneopterin aldolase [Salinicoccus hispanicus]